MIRKILSIPAISKLLFCAALAAPVPRQVLAFYYGWYGNPANSGGWVHWVGVDPANLSIANTAHFPALGAYDSHDPRVIDQQVTWARNAGITGFIASWWGRDSFPDHGMPLLLAAAGKQHFAVSAYYESIAGDSADARIKAAVQDIDYLLARYGSDPAWLRVRRQPVIFVYARAIRALSPAQWQTVLAQVRAANRGGVVLIADSLQSDYDAVFDGASTYSVTDRLKDKSPAEIAAVAHEAFPRFVRLAGAGKISTVTVIPGYDDRSTGRPIPRPITSRWGGETYRVLWREAIAAKPDYVLISTWNEWHEGSEIEPSTEFGASILNETPAFAKQFLSAPP